MRRSTLIAAFAVLLYLPASAQMRGAAHGGGARAAGGMHAVGMSARSHGTRGGSGHGWRHGGSGTSGSWHHHHHYYGSRYYGSRYGYGGYPGSYAYYPGWDWDYPLDYSGYTESYNDNQQLRAYQLQMMNNQQQIEQRIDALQDRLDRLYEQRSAPPQQTPPQTQSKSEPSRPAVLVYKDGHKQEVENYAIVGQTIWVLNERQAKKVPLSALDVSATRKANQDRDVDFALLASSS
ncbi:MAG TPA: hypothetical protein VMT53_13275 [Terriglobales bacterium]|nr:hypothetical protein [Terriglobales bacterium]